jgi:hypothetical protein
MALVGIHLRYTISGQLQNIFFVLAKTKMGLQMRYVTFFKFFVSCSFHTLIQTKYFSFSSSAVRYVAQDCEIHYDSTNPPLTAEEQETIDLIKRRTPVLEEQKA